MCNDFYPYQEIVPLYFTKKTGMCQIGIRTCMTKAREPPLPTHILRGIGASWVECRLID